MSKQDAITNEIPRLRRMSQGIKRTMRQFPSKRIITWCNVERSKLEKRIAELEQYFKLERSVD